VFELGLFRREIILEFVYLFSGVLVGIITGLLIGALRWKSQLSTVKAEVEAERDAAKLINANASEMSDRFKSLAAESLKNNSESFLTLAKENLGTFQQLAKTDLDKKKDSFEQLVKPVQESLKEVGQTLQLIEKARIGDQSSLKSQVENLSKQTGELANALRRPAIRGRWGEMQLRRVVEIAGMTEYCDFDEQVTVEGPEDKRLRPDMTIKLAGGKQIVVDAKTPMDAYLNSIETDDEELREQALGDHLEQMRAHVTNLSSKQYWDQFESSPELAVMFVPADSLFMAALDKDPNLVEWAAERHVFIASPITLITVLKAVAIGWTEESLAENAREIAELGKELHKRVGRFIDHFANVGTRLGSAVRAFNEATGSLERGLLPQARRFTDLKVGSDKDLSITNIEQTPRELQAPEAENPEDNEHVWPNGNLN
jgi:DNA recombination protein RmuC|tara:strand:- start:467 stop:1753 length:1287 start_codon:yes stop_codon:yes gene_type:complete